MTDAEKIADLERRVRELEVEKAEDRAVQNLRDAIFTPDPIPFFPLGKMCDACRNGGVCLCYRPERGATCAIA